MFYSGSRMSSEVLHLLNIVLLKMKGLTFLTGQVTALNQHNLRGATRALNISFFESNLKIFSQSLSSNFNSLHSVSKGNKSRENDFNNKNVEHKEETKSSSGKVSQSSDKKKKTKKIKLFTVKPEINDHDLQIKLKHVQKLVEKGMPVHIKVDNSKNLEGGFEKIFNEVQKCILQQKISAKISQTKQIININPINNEEDQEKNKNNFSDLTSES